MTEARDRLTDLLRDIVDPHPRHRIEQFDVDGKGVLVLVIEPNDGTGTLYALTVDKNKPEYFIRREGTTFYARPEEIAAIVRSSAPAVPHLFGA